MNGQRGLAERWDAAKERLAVRVCGRERLLKMGNVRAAPAPAAATPLLAPVAATPPPAEAAPLPVQTAMEGLVGSAASGE